MFVIEGREANADFRDQREIDSVIAAIHSEGYKPLLRSMLAGACTAAALSDDSLDLDVLSDRQRTYRRPVSRPKTVCGEVFFNEGFGYVLQPMGSTLNVWEIRRHDTMSSIECFCDLVAKSTRRCLDGRRVRGMSFEWRAPVKTDPRAFVPPSRLYQAVDLHTVAAEYTDEESTLAHVLVSADIRRFVLKLAEVGKTRMTDAAGDSDMNTIGVLLRHGLIQKENLITCRKDSHTICTTPDVSELKSGPGVGLTCAVCGRPFREEFVQEICALSDLGRQLVNGSQWMKIWVTDLLIDAGIQRDQIAWNPVSGQDELDIMTDALGPRVFFELKDREFGLGDAYPFSYRVSRYGGACGVVVTTDKVAEEAKKFFKEQRREMPAKVIMLEGTESTKEGIRELVEDVSRTGVTMSLAEASTLFPIDPLPIIRAWMNQP